MPERDEQLIAVEGRRSHDRGAERVRAEFLSRCHRERVHLAGDVDEESLGRLALGRKQELAGLTGLEIADGADDELALKRNVSAYAEIALHYRVLVDVAKRSLETTVLGQPVSMLIPEVVGFRLTGTLPAGAAMASTRPRSENPVSVMSHTTGGKRLIVLLLAIDRAYQTL